MLRGRMQQNAANGENNMDISVARLRQGFFMPCGMKIRLAMCQSH